jgi:hypothetical protein
MFTGHGDTYRLLSFPGTKQLSRVRLEKLLFAKNKNFYSSDGIRNASTVFT